MKEIFLGFTTKPGLFYRRAFKEAGRELGLHLHSCDLSSEDRVRWEKLDALILPGGPDIDPCYYLTNVDDTLRAHTRRFKSLVHQNKKTKKRDALEHALLMEVFHNRALAQLPILGIGRGMQMIAVAQGIPLYLDLRLETGMISSRFEYTAIEPVPGTKFHQLTGGRTFRTFKNQHQGIRLPYFQSHKEKWPHFRISGLSHDRQMAEAIELAERPVLGVQFHPEISFDEAPRKIFHWLLLEAQRRSEERRLILEKEYAF